MLATLLKPESTLPLDVQGDFRLDAPSGRTVMLRADGCALTLDVPGRQELSAMAPRSFAQRRRALATASRHLSTLGIALNVDIAGRRLLAFGAGVRPTLLSRALRLESVNLPWSALVNLWRR